MFQVQKRDKKTVVDYKQYFLDSADLSHACALPKTHKEGELTYRLIVSSIGSLLHKFAKFFQKILKHGMEEENFSVKNGLEFRKDIINTMVPGDYVLMSLDVKSIFTSIP